jgi:hypothetical protein
MNLLEVIVRLNVLFSLGVGSFVLGFLKDDEVDIESTRQVLSAALQLPATFHLRFLGANSASLCGSAVNSYAKAVNRRRRGTPSYAEKRLGHHPGRSLRLQHHGNLLVCVPLQNTIPHFLPS